MATEITATAGALLRFRNRDIGPQELEFLRATIATSGWRTLTDLSRIVWAAWAWRQRNGRLSEFACRDLLLRLAQWGHLDLGVRRRRGPRGSGRKKSGIPTELIPIAEIPLTDAEANLDALVVRPIEREERLGWRVYMERYQFPAKALQNAKGSPFFYALRNAYSPALPVKQVRAPRPARGRTRGVSRGST
jgi:hypothetical protein